MTSLFSASRARLRSREAIAAISLHSPFCIPGITLRIAMDAAPSTPHLTLPCFLLPSVAIFTRSTLPLSSTTHSMSSPRSSLSQEKQRRSASSRTALFSLFLLLLPAASTLLLHILHHGFYSASAC